jgi:hypothetical protein
MMISRNVRSEDVPAGATVTTTHNLNFQAPYPQASQVDARIPVVAGPTTNAHDAFSPLPGLGGVEVNPTGFERVSNPIVGGGVNLHPRPVAPLGAFDFNAVGGLLEWFPSAMTTLFSTRAGPVDSGN